MPWLKYRRIDKRFVIFGVLLSSVVWVLRFSTIQGVPKVRSSSL